MQTGDAVNEQAATVRPKEGQELRRPRPGAGGSVLPHVGRPKGTPNRVTRTIREAVERACQPGKCHPAGLAGWLEERAKGSLGDRQIFAAMVAKAMPLQVQANVSGGIRLELGWLGGRQIGASTAQIQSPAPQALDLQRETDGTYRIIDPHTQRAAAGLSPAPTAQEAAGDAEEVGGYGGTD